MTRLEKIKSALTVLGGVEQISLYDHIMENMILHGRIKKELSNVIYDLTQSNIMMTPIDKLDHYINNDISLLQNIINACISAMYTCGENLKEIKDHILDKLSYYADADKISKIIIYLILMKLMDEKYLVDLYIGDVPDYQLDIFKELVNINDFNEVLRLNEGLNKGIILTYLNMAHEREQKMLKNQIPHTVQQLNASASQSPPWVPA